MAAVQFIFNGIAMKLTLKNIGSITSTTIELSPLTVIAGENDSGKSTIGKVFFALIQAFSKYTTLVQQERNEFTRREIEKLLFEIRRNFDIHEYPNLKDLFSPFRLKKIIETNSDDIFLDVQNALTLIAENASNSKLALIEKIRSKLLILREQLEKNPSQNEAIVNSILKSLSSEFNGEIKNKTNNDEAYISISDGETKLFELKFNNNEEVEYSGGDNLSFEDATFVDGPAIIQFHKLTKLFNNVIDNTIFGRAMPYHVYDLGQKLTLGRIGLLGIERSKQLNLGQTYKGKLYFDSEENNFFLDKGNYRVSSGNIASGVKAFGMLELLVDAGCVRDGTVLILDEPETNLHPKWQIEFSRALCTLVSQGATILVTTHSPYIVEALKGFSDKASLNSKFYLAKRSADIDIKYLDSSSDISSIIKALAEPLRNLLKEISDDF